MNTKTRERTMRILLSSLLESNLTVREMNEISNAFLDDSDFPQTFGQLIKDIVISMETNTRSLKPKSARAERSEIDETPVKTALSLIKEKHILKAVVLKKLRTLSPDTQAFVDQLPQKLSMTEILHRCYHERPQQFHKFLSQLRSKEIPHDDYLEGILQKE